MKYYLRNRENQGNYHFKLKAETIPDEDTAIEVGIKRDVRGVKVGRLEVAVTDEVVGKVEVISVVDLEVDG